METGGVSITVTSLTNLAAFALGSITSISAIRWFCQYAAIAVAADYVLQITFFLACFVLTERRIAVSRYECVCCLQRTPEDTLARAHKRGAASVSATSSSGTVAAGAGADPLAGAFAAAPRTQTVLPFAPTGAVRAAEADAAETISHRHKAEVRCSPR